MAEARILITVATVAALAFASPGWGQTSSRPKPRRPPSRPVVVVAPEPAKPAQSPARLALPPLLSAGDAGPRCRSQCSITRYSCLAAGDGQDCDPAWNTCLKACARP